MGLERIHRPVYKTSDGELFTDEKKAQEHELRFQLNQWADKSAICRGGEWSADMIVDQMYKDRKVMMAIFSQSFIREEVIEPTPVPPTTEQMG